MRAIAIRMFLLLLIVVLTGGCTNKTTIPATEKYPKQNIVSEERKSGPAMLFYEAAEADADPNNVIVIPPNDSTKKTP